MTLRDIFARLHSDAIARGWGSEWATRWFAKFPPILQDAEATLEWITPPSQNEAARITMTLTKLVFSITSDGYIIGLDPERGAYP